MSRMTTRTARVNDLFTRAIARNDDHTPIIGTTEELLEKHYVLGMRVPVTPDHQGGRVVPSSIRIQFHLFRTDSMDTLTTQTIIWTRKAEYFLRDDNGAFSIGVIPGSTSVPPKDADDTLLKVDGTDVPTITDNPVHVEII